MSRNRAVLMALAAAVVIAVVALILLRRGGGADEAATAAGPTALVTVAPVRSQTVQDVVTLYGVVQGDPAAVMTLAAPRAVIVSRVLVRPGQSVAAGQPLIEMTSAPAAQQAYRQAADALSFANGDLARVQRLYDERLAASDQLAAARKAVADAQSAVAAQQAQGGGQARQTLTAPSAGVVTSLTANLGDHLAQDAPMLVLARAGGAAARLGLEPSSGRVTAGDAVTVRPVSGGAPIDTRISMVAAAADPATRTLDAIAPLRGGALPIGAAVQAEVVRGAHPGLTAPRAAVVFDETGPHVFTVAGGKARRVFVTVGLDQGDQVEIRGPIAPGAQVAVEGAYELQHGMAVKVRAQ